MNVMPFLYSKIEPVPRQIQGFRVSILSGLGTCAVLNVLWSVMCIHDIRRLPKYFKFIPKIKHVMSKFLKISEGGSLVVLSVPL